MSEASLLPGTTRRAVEDIRGKIQQAGAGTAAVAGGRKKVIEQPRFLVQFGLYLNPPLFKKGVEPVVGPAGLVTYGRFPNPSPKSPLRAAFTRRQWLKR